MNAGAEGSATHPDSGRVEEWLAASSLASLDDACLGQGLPEEAQRELDAASAAYASEQIAEAHLRRALVLAPLHPAAHIGLYRFYFYRNRLADALATGLDCLSAAARLNGLPAAWRDVRSDQAEFGSYSALPRFYLFSLKACAYLNLRLADLATGSAMLVKLGELDPADRLGGSVLRAVVARQGTDDD